MKAKAWPRRRRSLLMLPKAARGRPVGDEEHSPVGQIVARKALSTRVPRLRSVLPPRLTRIVRRSPRCWQRWGVTTSMTDIDPFSSTGSRRRQRNRALQGEARVQGQAANPRCGRKKDAADETQRTRPKIADTSNVSQHLRSNRGGTQFTVNWPARGEQNWRELKCVLRVFKRRMTNSTLVDYYVRTQPWIYDKQNRSAHA